MKAIEYIKYFDNHTEYEEFKASKDFVKPNVSHCVAENDVHYTAYKPEEPTDDFFNLEYTLEEGLTTATVYGVFLHRGEITSFKVDGSDVDTSSQIGYRFGDYDFGTSGKHTAKMDVIDVTNLRTFFDSCYSLSKAVLPSGATEIEAIFNQCNSLEYAELPSTVTSANIYGGEALKTLKIWATTPPPLNAGMFDNTAQDFEILVPKESVDAYKQAENWSAYADKIKPIK